MKGFKLALPLIVILASVMACVTPSALLNNNMPELAVNLPTQMSLPPIVMPEIQLSNQQDLRVTIYDRVSPAVVSIHVVTDQGDSLGSGFVYDSQGNIITNFHVVDGANDLEINFPSGFKTRGKVIGIDKDSDIAVVKVDAPATELFPVTLGNSDNLKVGQDVIAIGNPFGLNGTMTTGIVSALGRTLDSLHESANGSGVYTAGDLIQTDAAINPGNSGGPLLNLQGEVIGINRAIRSNSSITGEAGNIGIGFAISINIVKRVVPELIANGKYEYPYLGLSSLPEIGLSIQEELGLPQSVGAYVTDVVSGGPADKAGIIPGTTETSIQGIQKGGDLIIAIDGQKILTFGDMLKYLINNKGPGDTVVLSILRDGVNKEITLTLGARP